MPPDLVTIGRVVKPHGIRGEVVVEVLSDVEGRFDAGNVVMVDGRPVTIATSRPHQARLLVGFTGTADRAAAEQLRGAEITAEAVDVADFDTYFVHELVGMRVIADDGTPLGTVRAWIELPAAAGYDLLEVEHVDGRRWMLPAADDFVQVADDPEGGQWLQLVGAPDGLVDLGSSAREPGDDAAQRTAP